MAVTIKHGGAYTKDGEISIESRDVIAVTGDTDALFLAMESPFEEVISHAAKHGSLAELLDMVQTEIAKMAKEAA
ncbi:hypothetical protein MNY64_04905 [Moellerella wisconsensis]|uniref:hypothetical protein n=1 Tax=Moellerella wisconsensis TaxID=158849 RepID=UPI001F4DF462|nr:hypothetical protein [Moellerella wisconsensis]UNH28149.1 hypothetical protein MNY64_04905 [Moellerella wisconsensis]